MVRTDTMIYEGLCKYVRKGYTWTNINMTPINLDAVICVNSFQKRTYRLVATALLQFLHQTSEYTISNDIQVEELKG